MNDILELQKKIQSNNVSLRQHWSVRRRDKQEWALLVRNQMKLRKIKKAEKKKYTILETASCSNFCQKKKKNIL